MHERLKLTPVNTQQLQPKLEQAIEIYFSSVGVEFDDGAGRAGRI